MTARLKDERGFTLTELLIVVALLGFIMGALFTLQRQGQVAYQVGAARVEVQQNARIALESMMGELRTALAITAIDNNCGNNTGGTSVTFNEQGGTAVTYATNGTELRRNGVPVIGGVANLRIFCRDAAGGLTAVLLDIRAIQVSITTQTERPTAVNQPGNQSAVLEARVRLRNLI